MSNRLILRLLTLMALTASILGFQNCSRSLVLEICYDCHNGPRGD